MNGYVIRLEDKRVQYLMKKDPRLAAAVRAVGDLDCSVHEDGYAFTVGEIMEQMLSTKVSRVLYGRLTELCGGQIAPRSIAARSADELRGIGISRAKADCLLDFTQRVINGQIDFAALEKMTDQEVMHCLMQVRGIGPWTSKMVLIFVLDRPDVLPYEDGAFLASYRWLYETEDTSRAAVEKKCRKWKPYSSLAARYLYRALDTGLTKRKIVHKNQYIVS